MSALIRVAALIAVAFLAAPTALPPPFVTATWGGGSKDIPSTVLYQRGHVVVVGNTYSPDYPITLGVAPRERWCGFVTRLAASHGSLIYSTTICGDADVTLAAAAANETGGLWLAGTTADDGVLVRLGRDGERLDTIRIGGTATDAITGIVVINEGLWLVGTTASRDLGSTSDAPQRQAAGGDEGFLALVDRTGHVGTLTYLGGDGDDRILGIVDMAGGRLAVAGTTRSSAPPFGTSRGRSDGFVGVFDPTARRWSWIHRVGGGGDDSLRGIAVAGERIVAVGASSSCAGEHARDGWIVSLTAAGEGRVESCLGGRYDDEIRGIAVDRTGTAWVTGVTESGDFPFANTAVRTNYYSRGFVARVDPARAVVLDVAPLGSDDLSSMRHSRGHAIAPAPDGALFVAGEGVGTEYAPSRGAFNSAQRFGSTDVFVRGFR